MTKKLIKGLMLVLLASFLILPACGGGGGSGGGSGFLTGTWAGTLDDSTTGVWNMVMAMNHDGTNVRGTITLTLGGTTLTGNFTGTVSSPTADGTTSFAWVISSSGATYTYVGTYTAVEIKGTWTNMQTSVTDKFRVNKV